MTNVTKNLNGAANPAVADDGKAMANNGDRQEPMEVEHRMTVDDPTAASPIDREIQKHLGQKLKASYDDLVRQPVPDKFRQLLEELELRGKKS